MHENAQAFTDCNVPDGLVVCAQSPCHEGQARALAERLGVEHCVGTPSDDALSLLVNDQGVSLVGNGMVMQGDFRRMLPRLKQSNLHKELLVKAVKMKGASGPLTVVDATAGLGEDSLLLAAAGMQVHLLESDPLVAVLLEDALQRATDDPVLERCVQRMHAREADSMVALRQLDFVPDVVYLDPMFPAKTKNAAAKKKFQVIHLIEPPCENQQELLDAAKAANPKKIVIKRPVKAPYLADVKPSYSLTGKTIRYDCIVLPR